MQPVESSSLETTQHFCICPLYLSIAHWVSNRRISNLISKFLAIHCEGAACELGATVGDDPVVDTKMGNQSFEELDGLLCHHLPHWLHLRPLCKLVDCNTQEFKAPSSTGEGADNAEPQDRERPGERDGLEGLSWLVDVLGVELACFAPDNHR